MMSAWIREPCRSLCSLVDNSVPTWERIISRRFRNKWSNTYSGWVIRVQSRRPGGKGRGKQKSLELAFKRPRTTPARQSDVLGRPRRFLLEKMRLHLTAGHFINRRVRHLSGCRSPVIWIVPAVRIFGLGPGVYCNAPNDVSGFVPICVKRNTNKRTQL